MEMRVGAGANLRQLNGWTRLNKAVEKLRVFYPISGLVFNQGEHRYQVNFVYTKYVQ